MFRCLFVSGGFRAWWSFSSARLRADIPHIRCLNSRFVDAAHIQKHRDGGKKKSIVWDLCLDQLRGSLRVLGGETCGPSLSQVRALDCFRGLECALDMVKDLNH